MIGLGLAVVIVVSLVFAGILLILLQQREIEELKDFIDENW